MAVLKRVCEETPPPIREINPEIPDWLVAIIDKLHAKDPGRALPVGGRGGRAAGPAPGPPAASVGRGGGCQPACGRGRRQARPARPTRRAAWPSPRAACCLLVGSGLTEATGVTNVRATVIRILTPDGTLVVETDDPGVKVTVEGDGGLVISRRRPAGGSAAPGQLQGPRATGRQEGPTRTESWSASPRTVAKSSR